MPDQDPSPRFSYRLLPNGAGWYWELLDSEHAVLDHGIADDRVRARAQAFQALFKRNKTFPEHPDGK
jgi:hypothetical protein